MIAGKTTDAPRSVQAGLTLVELMVVVAIVGILMSAAGVMLNQKPTAEDEGRRLAHVIAEASRKAVAGGAADPEFVKAQVSIDCLSNESGMARTMVQIYPSGDYQVAAIQRLVEFDENGDILSQPWDEEIIDKRVVSANVEVRGFRETAELNPGTVPETTLTSGTPVKLCCFPSGSCHPNDPDSTSGLTIYLRDNSRMHDARVVVMPLRGVPMVYSEW